MSSLLLFVLLALLATAHSANTFGDYLSRLTDEELQNILNNSRILKNYVKCVVDKGPCTAEGRDIKEFLPEVVTNKCADCSPEVKTNVRKTVNAMKKRYPEEWKEIVEKYDPDDSHAEELKEFLESKND